MKLIEDYRSIFLQETAVTANEANSKDIGLWIGVTGGNQIVFVLYDTKKVNGFPTQDDVYGYGVIKKEITTPYNCYIIELSVAKNGWGPLLYDIMINWTGRDGLAPDRETISPAAQAVWKYYFHHRDDVLKRPIDDRTKPLTPTRVDDGRVHVKVDSLNAKDPLDFVYSFKAPKNYRSLESNHTEYLNSIETFDASEEFLDKLDEVGYDFFHKHFFGSRVHNMLHEDAISLSHAEHEHIGLYIRQNGLITLAILYATDNSMKDQYGSRIIGYGKMEKGGGTPFGCWVIGSTAARKGYGPLLYDILLTLAGRDGVAPDRTSVSSYASKVWEYYTRRRLDVRRRPIDDETDPVTPEFFDDGQVHFHLKPGQTIFDRSPLDFVYYISHPLNLAHLVKNYTIHMQTLKANGKAIEALDFDKEIEKEGYSFFQHMYAYVRSW